MRKLLCFLTAACLLSVAAFATATEPNIARPDKAAAKPKDGAQQVAISVTVMEVSHTKLREIGIKLPPSELASAGDFDKYLAALENRAAFYEDLKKKNLVRILAEPTLVTISGRKASFASGEGPPNIKQKQKRALGCTFDFQVDAHPMHIKNDAWQVDVHATLWETNPKRTMTVEGEQVPMPMARKASSVLPMRLGETLPLGGLVQLRREKIKDAQGHEVERVDQVETVFLVTLKPVEETAAYKAFRAGQTFRGAGQKFRIENVIQPEEDGDDPNASTQQAIGIDIAVPVVKPPANEKAVFTFPTGLAR